MDRELKEKTMNSIHSLSLKKSFLPLWLQVNPLQHCFVQGPLFTPTHSKKFDDVCDFPCIKLLKYGIFNYIKQLENNFNK